MRNRFQKQRKIDNKIRIFLPVMICGIMVAVLWNSSSQIFRETKKRQEESLKAVGMIEYRHHSPNKLSGGQKQRVAIAGVVAMEPKCIVMDEPTAMLDPVGRREVLKTVHKLRKQKKVTVILITHYMLSLIHI